MSFFTIKYILVNDYPNYGPYRLYKKVIELIQDQQTADNFMLSNHGGFTKSELNKIKRDIRYRKYRYQKNLLS